MTDPFTYPRSWGEFKGVKITQEADGFHAGKVFIPLPWPNTAKQRVEAHERILEVL